MNLEAIKSIPMESIVEAFGGEIARGGFVLCPVHSESTPSCKIYPDGFKCYGCGWTGDQIEYVKGACGVQFKDACKAIEHAFGLATHDDAEYRQHMEEMARERESRRAQKEQTERERCKDQVKVQTAFFSKLGFPTSHPASTYLEGRCIPHDIAREAGCKTISDPHRASQWLRSNFSPEQLMASGLFNDRGNFRLYRHTLIFPFWFDGQCMGAQARNIKPDDGPKELTIGSPLKPFNADILHTNPPNVYLTEGAIDCLSMLTLGEPAIGIPGTSGFKAEWVQMFKGTVFVAFDGDTAGRRGALKIEQALRSQGINAYASTMRPNSDLNDYLKLQTIPAESSD